MHVASSVPCMQAYSHVRGHTSSTNVGVLFSEGWQVVNAVGRHEGDFRHRNFLAPLGFGAAHHFGLVACKLIRTHVPPHSVAHCFPDGFVSGL